MSFPRYPKYKDSGVEWLGDVPEHWEVIKLGRAAFMQEGPGLRNWQFTDEGTRVICVTNITENGIDFSRLEKFISIDEFTSSYLHFTVQSGDILLSSSGNSWGKVAIYSGNEKVMLNTSTIRLNEFAGRPLARDFLAMVLQSDTVREQLGLAMTGSCQPNFGPTHLSCVLVTVPPREEQTLLAAFLDRETAKIDELVAEQRRLIELLKEKRQAVISHAVTKGLNPHAPMKPSGIEWLGDVPEHWEVKRICRVGQLQNGLNIGGDAFGTGAPFVSYGDVYKNANLPDVPSGFVESAAEDQMKCSIEAGDVLFTRTSETVDDIGIASTCLASIPRATFAGFLIRLRPAKGILDPRFSTYLFRNDGVKRHFSGTMNLVTRASLSQDVLKMLPIGIPPISEQREIAAFIEQRGELFQSLTAEAQRGIELLQERRTALISAAVTGKIDVREVCR